MIKVYFDASVIFAALYSSTGGSYKLVSLVKNNVIIGITSQTVIKELENNLEKLKIGTTDQIHHFIINNNFYILEKISLQQIQPFINKINLKDAHIIAGATITNSNYLVTLDKKHINNQKVKKAFTNLLIVSPKELLKLLK